MKTKRWVLTALAFLIVAIGVATETPEMEVVKTDKQKALITYKATFKSPLEISLTDNNGELLFFKRTNKPFTEYSTVIDFGDLGDGDYDISINYGNQSINRHLAITDKKMKISNSERLFEPYYLMNEGKLIVSHFNVPKKQVHLNIYKDGKQISQINLGKEISIQKCVDMTRLEKGNYELVLNDYFKKHRFFVQL